jgi:activator of HSP90 ATPase
MKATLSILRLESRKMKDLKKYYIIPATPEEVYNALTNPLAIRLWTGEPAKMSEEPGSEFSLWDESICGRNISFIPGKKIEQQWYFGDQEEPSIVTIILHPHTGGTSVELRHKNIPDSEYEEIRQGWDESYFQALDEFFS